MPPKLDKELSLISLHVVPDGIGKTWQALNFKLDGKHIGGGVFQRDHIAKFVKLLRRAGATVHPAEIAQLVYTQKETSAVVPVKQLPKFKPAKKRR